MSRPSPVQTVLPLGRSKTTTCPSESKRKPSKRSLVLLAKRNLSVRTIGLKPRGAIALALDSSSSLTDPEVKSASVSPVALLIGVDLVETLITLPDVKSKSQVSYSSPIRRATDTLPGLIKIPPVQPT